MARSSSSKARTARAAPYGKPLLTEWLESEGFAVQTMGLRRSYLVGEDIDGLLAENAVTRMTLLLMYSTDFFDQLERRSSSAGIGSIVLADLAISSR